MHRFFRVIWLAFPVALLAQHPPVEDRALAELAASSSRDPIVVSYRFTYGPGAVAVDLNVSGISDSDRQDRMGIAFDLVAGNHKYRAQTGLSCAVETCRGAITIADAKISAHIANAEIMRMPPQTSVTEAKIRRGHQSSQPDMASECVAVVGIRSHGFSILSGVAQPYPGIETDVRNNCSETASISISIGYFDGKGEQVADDSELLTLAAGAHRQLFHENENIDRFVIGTIKGNYIHEYN